MNKMTQLIETYIASKSNAWASSTLVTERQRLTSVADHLTGDAQALWDELVRRELGAYTRVTMWARVSCFYDWCLARGKLAGGNPYKVYREENARHFKAANVYKPKHVQMSFSEAKKRIATIDDMAIRDKAMQLLTGGLRYTESFTQGASQLVTGKGGKIRRVYSQAPATQFEGCYHTFWRALKKATGLTPHALRKILATELARKDGIKEAELCAVFGWESFETAKKYIAPKDEGQLAAAVGSITDQGEDENGDEQVPA